MNPDEKNIIRKALIEIDYQIKQAIKAHNVDFQQAIEHMWAHLNQIPLIKKKLLKDLKMPEAE